jgi:hypothetical protein
MLGTPFCHAADSAASHLLQYPQMRCSCLCGAATKPKPNASQLPCWHCCPATARFAALQLLATALLSLAMSYEQLDFILELPEQQLAAVLQGSFHAAADLPMTLTLLLSLLSCYCTLCCTAQDPQAALQLPARGWHLHTHYIATPLFMLLFFWFRSLLHCAGPSSCTAAAGNCPAVTGNELRAAVLYPGAA